MIASRGVVLPLLIALGCTPGNAAIWSPHLEALAPQFGLAPELAAAVLASESVCRARARGARGEVGGFQILRGASTPGQTRWLRDDVLELPGVNATLGLRRLAASRDACKGPPLAWLSEYNSGKCAGPTGYARKIHARLHRAQRKLRLASR